MRKKPKYNTKESHETTREERKRKEQRGTMKKLELIKWQ